jgi:hypothetical protein
LPRGDRLGKKEEKLADKIVKRIAPSYGFMLKGEQMGGGKFEIAFRLCFDFATFKRIKEATGLELVSNPEAWSHLGDADCLPEMFWAAIIRHHPAYDNEDGLDAVRSYIDAENADSVGEAVIEAYLVTLPVKLGKTLRAAWEAAKRGEHPADPTQPPTEMAAPQSGNLSTTSGQ